MDHKQDDDLGLVEEWDISMLFQGIQQHIVVGIERKGVLLVF